jgi:hypothetical protein
MRMRRNGVHVWLFSMTVLVPMQAWSSTEHRHQSGYVGQEKRAIKSLSKQDIEELEHGKGWGLAKAAELNGIPGPAHLLEMKEELPLQPGQVKRIKQIYLRMRSEAIKLGKRLVQLERELNRHFAERTISKKTLEEILTKISNTRRDLRLVHLSTHLETPKILTHDQIRKYNVLRGYK